MTDVTGNQGQAEVDLSAADEQVLRELTERAPAVDVLGVSQRLGPAAGVGRAGREPANWGCWRSVAATAGCFRRGT